MGHRRTRAGRAAGRSATCPRRLRRHVRASGRMSTLAAEQQALVEALFAWPAEDAMKKIAAYAGVYCAKSFFIEKSNC